MVTAKVLFIRKSLYSRRIKSNSVQRYVAWLDTPLPPSAAHMLLIYSLSLTMLIVICSFFGFPPLFNSDLISLPCLPHLHNLHIPLRYSAAVDSATYNSTGHSLNTHR